MDFLSLPALIRFIQPAHRHCYCRSALGAMKQFKKKELGPPGTFHISYLVLNAGRSHLTSQRRGSRSESETIRCGLPWLCGLRCPSSCSACRTSLTRSDTEVYCWPVSRYLVWTRLSTRLGSKPICTTVCTMGESMAEDAAKPPTTAASEEEEEK